MPLALALTAVGILDVPEAIASRATESSGAGRKKAAPCGTRSPQQGQRLVMQLCKSPAAPYPRAVMFHVEHSNAAMGAPRCPLHLTASNPERRPHVRLKRLVTGGRKLVVTHRTDRAQSQAGSVRVEAKELELRGPWQVNRSTQ